MGNLKKEDFQIFDNNKPQAISGFSIQKRAATANPPLSADPVSPSPAATTTPATTPERSKTMPERFVVFLFDDMHLDTSDLTQLQKVANKMVAESLTDSDLAAAVSTSGTSSGLTHDRAKLQDAIMNLKVQNLYRHIRGCPNIEYYEADRVQKKRDLMATDTAIENAMACCDCARETARTLVEEALFELFSSVTRMFASSSALSGTLSTKWAPCPDNACSSSSPLAFSPSLPK